MDWSGFIFITSHDSILTPQTDSQESVSRYLFKRPVLFVGLVGSFLFVFCLAEHIHSLTPGAELDFEQATSNHTKVSEHVCLSCFCLGIFSDPLLCQTSRGQRRSEDSPVYFLRTAT